MAAMLQMTFSNAFSIFLNERVKFFTKVSPKFVPNGPIDDNPALVSIMAWCQISNMPLFEPMLTFFTEAYVQL